MCTKCIIRVAIIATISMATSTQAGLATPAQDVMAIEARGTIKSFATDLKDLYPQDTATGFKRGDLRGAFTLSKPLN